MLTSCQEKPRLLSTELSDFARRQLVNAKLYGGDERRTDNRHLMLLPVWVVPINAENQPIGEPIQMITRDVSATGVGLYHEEEIGYERLAIHMRLANTDVDLVVQIVWEQPMGPFYGSAATYLERLESFPVDIPV